MKVKIRYKGTLKANDELPDMYSLVFDYGIISDNWVGEDGKFSDEWPKEKLIALSEKVANEVGLFEDYHDERMQELVYVGEYDAIVAFEKGIDEVLNLLDDTPEYWVDRLIEEGNTIRLLGKTEAEEVFGRMNQAVYDATVAEEKATDEKKKEPIVPGEKSDRNIWEYENLMIGAIESGEKEAAKKFYDMIYNGMYDLAEAALDHAQYEDLWDRREEYFLKIKRTEEYKKGAGN